MMKSVVASFLLVAVCFAVGVFAEEEHDPMGMKETVKECAAERNIAPDELKAMIPPKDDEEKLTLECVATCTLQKTGMLVDNKLQVDEMKAMVDKMPHKDDEHSEEIKANIDECAQMAEGATGECGVGGAFTECFLGKIPHGKHHHN